MSTHTTSGNGACGFCGNWHGKRCPEVKRIEYWPNGTLKSVEYRVGTVEMFVDPALGIEGKP